MTDDFLNLSSPHVQHPWPDQGFPRMHPVQKLLPKKQEAWPGLREVPVFEKNDRNSVRRLNEPPVPFARWVRLHYGQHDHVPARG